MNKLQVYKMIVLVLITLTGLSGCNNAKSEVVVDETPSPVVSQTNPIEATSIPSESSSESSSGNSVSVTYEDVKMILLKDSDGNLIKSDFTENRTNEILDALLNSIQLEESGPEVLEGHTLTLVIDEAPILFIQGYGSEDRVVMTVDNEDVYHLECALIAQLLLNQ